MSKGYSRLQKTLHWFISNKHRVLPVLLLGGVFSWYAIGFRAHTHSLYFPDETDHITMGWMISEHDKQLYTELSVNHQPLPFLLSAVIVPIFEYGTLYELILQARTAMFLFTALATLVITIRFGYTGLLATALTYSLGYLYFGWYILAESFAAPAIIYIVLFILDLLISSRPQHTWSVIGFALSAFWVVFNLLAVVPFVGLMTLLALWKLSSRERIVLLGTGAAATLALFLVVQPAHWFEESVLNIWNYFISDEQHKLLNIGTILGYPFLGITKLGVDISRALLIVGGTIALSAVVLVTRSKQKLKVGALLVLCYILISFLNTRVQANPAVFYTGFHAFPYLAGLFSLFAYLCVRASAGLPTRTRAALCILLVLTILHQNTGWTREEKDRMNEYFIQYGWQDSHARAISLIAKEGDTLFSAPNGHGYLNLMTELPIAGRQLFHLQWAYRSPKLRGEFQTLMQKNPPTFVYLTEDESGYHTELAQILPQEYRIFYQHEKFSELFVHSSRATALTELQHAQLRELGYVVASQSATAARFAYEGEVE